MTQQIIEFTSMGDLKVKIVYTGEYNDNSQGQNRETRTHDLAKELCEERAQDLGVHKTETFFDIYYVVTDGKSLPWELVAKAGGYSIAVKDGTLRLCLPSDVPHYLGACLAIFIGQLTNNTTCLETSLNNSRAREKALEEYTNALVAEANVLRQDLAKNQEELAAKRRLVYQSATEKKKAFMIGRANIC